MKGNYHHVETMELGEGVEQAIMTGLVMLIC